MKPRAKLLCLLCALPFASAESIPGQSDTSGPAANERCEVWGRVVAPSSVLKSGFDVELGDGESQYRQRTHLVDGSFEFKTVPAGIYQFRVLNRSGGEIIRESRRLTGTHDHLLLHLPPQSASGSAGVVSLRELDRKLPKKALEALRSGDRAADAGDWEKSIANYEKASAMAPNFAEAESSLATHYARIGDLENWLGHARKAYEADPDFPVSGYNLAVALIAFKRYQEAELILRSTLKTQVQFTELHGLLADSLAGQGKEIEEALEHLRLAANEIPWQRLLFADSLVDSGRIDLAIAQVQQYMRSGASDCERQELQQWMAKAATLSSASHSGSTASR